MDKRTIAEIFSKNKASRQMLGYLGKDAPKKTNLSVKGLVGSALSFASADLFSKAGRSMLLILQDKEKAAYIYNDLQELCGDERVVFYPASYRRAYQVELTENANVLSRAEILNRINTDKSPLCIVTYPDALFEKVISHEDFEKNIFHISVTDKFSIEFITELLYEYGFEKTDFVTGAGEFSIRGGIIDVFSFSNEMPYRVEFFGDEVESVRTFDVETQLSVEKVSAFSLIPNVEIKASGQKRESFLNFIDPQTIVLCDGVELAGVKIGKIYDKALEEFAKVEDALIRQSAPGELYLDEQAFLWGMEKLSVAEVSSRPFFKADAQIVFNSEPQPVFHRNFTLLDENLRENTDKGVRNIIFCSNEKQAERLSDIFRDMDSSARFDTLVFPVYEGFIDRDTSTAFYTDHQIFERYHRFKLKNEFTKKDAITLEQLGELEMGDYVTHIDHGIGKFAGLQKIDVEGRMQEAIKLIYSGGDILYVSIHSLHKISKYNGKDGTAPKINKLGSPAWKTLKDKTKRRVKEIAFDLIKLYAKRRTVKGHAFPPDNYLQNELEASFLYEDTPDQLKATQAVKSDMENPRPMDRLVCGDVGFGKTEVAIRAAFKAVCDSKQVAVLVPTTVLAFQHFRSFSSRLKRMPVRVEYLNRFRSTLQKTQILKDLADGKIDILIGTHQIVGDKIKYKDLGLLIIDEEHKFGVSVKEKLKNFKNNIDTLTLTATPIPRTLQFSLMSARDLSIIATPPPNRHPIETQIVTLDEEIIRDAISYEISRGGQVYFIHNRVENIREVAGMITRLVPDAKIGIGHGQMQGKELETLMLSFMEGEFDVLVSTTIVESGLDVPNANTIFVNNANNFGLSDLHQMRGRVGRSNKKAFCYYIAPPLSVLTEDARKRLEALEKYSGVGQGFNIAMKDLEIRGAGDLLGAEQSGFISDIGFETYQKILNEAVSELRESEFAEVYKDDHNDSFVFNKPETQIDTDFEILIPDGYVNSSMERLKLYNRLMEIKTDDELAGFKMQMEDRFGAVPKQVEDLLLSVRIKREASELGFERLILKRGKMIAYLVSNAESPYYKSEVFSGILVWAQKNASFCAFREKQDSSGAVLLTLNMERIKSLPQVYDLLAQMLDESAH